VRAQGEADIEAKEMVEGRVAPPGWAAGEGGAPSQYEEGGAPQRHEEGGAFPRYEEGGALQRYEASAGGDGVEGVDPTTPAAGGGGARAGTGSEGGMEVEEGRQGEDDDMGM
jgi:hypothetical protein